VILPDVRYAKSGDLHIAYRVDGDSRLDLVVIPPLGWSIHLPWLAAESDAVLRRLASFARVIIFDKRGTGASDRVVGAPTLEERMDDVLAVMEATESSRAAVLGVSDGGAMSLLFAATYPERVFALALFRAKPRFIWAADFPWAPTRDEYARETAAIIAQKGTAQEVEDWKNDLAAHGKRLTDEEARLRTQVARLVSTPGSILALRRMNMSVDVRPVLSAIQQPTLVMYRSRDAPDAEETRDEPQAHYIGEHIPHARVVEVPGREGFLDAAAPFLEDFLPEAWDEHQSRSAAPQRVLATVLFTDLLDSTLRATELGPRWQELLRAHNAAIRRQLVRFRGQEIDTAGDGFFASGFDGPARAIHCACAIRDAIHELGLGIRIGLHTGECDVVDGKLAGLAVNTGARIAAQARDGEVLVSRTVRDLVAGSGIEFEERGVRDLKGLGEWTLYAVRASADRRASSTFVGVSGRP
jgi:class 3 adenylate cyclase/pimeloyl-ACP methyl ester carboxylesterase